MIRDKLNTLVAAVVCLLVLSSPLVAAVGIMALRDGDRIVAIPKASDIDQPHQRRSVAFTSADAGDLSKR